VEFLDLIQIADIADIGFVLLVVAACLRGLVASAEQSVVDDPARYEELRHVEAMLRELVAEAGAASANLDRQLLARKRELESLLGRLEAVEQHVGESVQAVQNPNAARSSQAVKPAAAPQAVEEDLPNASWVAAPLPLEEEEPFELDALLSDTADTVSFSNDSELASPLADQIEVSDAANQTDIRMSFGDREGESLLSQLDPIAVKVARRLIADGQEIHKIARKLDLPIAQVRVLDRLLRNQMQGVSANIDTAAELRRSANAF
jgi:hypothetical protein